MRQSATVNRRTTDNSTVKKQTKLDAKKKIEHIFFINNIDFDGISLRAQ